VNSFSNLKQIFKANSNFLFYFLLVFSLLLCVWQTINFFTCDKIAALTEEQEELRARKEQLTEFTSRAAEIENEWNDHRETLDNAPAIAARASEVPFVLADLEKMINSYPVTLDTFRAEEITRVEEYDMVSITINVSGSTTFLQRLLKTLEEDFSYLLQVEQFAWITCEIKGVSMELKLCLIVADSTIAALP